MLVAVLAVSLWLPEGATAAPITVAGFTFVAGEEAFADDAVVVSGTVTGAWHAADTSEGAWTKGIGS